MMNAYNTQPYIINNDKIMTNVGITTIIYNVNNANNT